MTDTKKPKGRPSDVMAAAVLCAALLLLAEADAAGDAAKGALKLCATVIIPSLFPYMAAAGMMVSLGTADLLGKRLSALTRRLFHLPGQAASAWILGALCGFPVGAQTACALHRESRLTKEEAERLIALANNTGPAFVIEVVGAHCWGSRGFGLAVYLAQIVSALLIGAVYARRHTPFADSPSPFEEKYSRRTDLLTAVAETVSAAAFSVLNVCGFVVFFAVVLSLAERMLTGIGTELLLPVLGTLLEFTAGTSYAASLGGVPGAFLTGFAVGWSGISVFAQCRMFTAPLSLRLTPAAVCKGIQGILTGTAAAVYYRFFFTPSSAASTCIPITDTPRYLVLGEVLLLILFCLFPVFYQKLRRTGRGS